MGSSKEDVTDDVPAGKLQQKEDPATGTNKSESKEKGSCDSMSAEVVSDELHKRLSPDALAQASQSNREESAHPTTCQEVSGEVQPRKSLDEGIDVSQSNQDEVPEEDSKIVHQKKGIENESGASEFSQVPILPKQDLDKKSCESDNAVKDRDVSLVHGNASGYSEQIQSQNAEVFASQSDQEQETYFTRPEKALEKLQPRRNTDMTLKALPSDQGSNPSRAPEISSEDGYNWRKYGQKLVRGNEFTRSYYRCTYPNCLAKKQVERSHDGHITDIYYIAKHEHPNPLFPQISPEFVLRVQMGRPDIPSASCSEGEGEKSTVLGQTCRHIEQLESPLPLTIISAGGSGKDTVSKMRQSGDEADKNGGPDMKRQKKEVPRSDDTPPIKSHSEPRHIVQTKSEVDIVNDGYRWRKYGQKFVKGNPNPRSYYRCSSAGCSMKKHVERASDDPKSVITTYEGHHDHDTPSSRTVPQNSAGTDSNTTCISGESRSESSGENKRVVINTGVHIGAN